jgi:hypothetical protein
MVHWRYQQKVKIVVKVKLLSYFFKAPFYLKSIKVKYEEIYDYPQSERCRLVAC